MQLIYYIGVIYIYLHSTLLDISPTPLNHRHAYFFVKDNKTLYIGHFFKANISFKWKYSPKIKMRSSFVTLDHKTSHMG